MRKILKKYIISDEFPSSKKRSCGSQLTGLCCSIKAELQCLLEPSPLLFPTGFTKITWLMAMVCGEASGLWVQAGGLLCPLSLQQQPLVVP